jgi:hypothetical protein
MSFLHDGYSTLISFDLAPSVKFKEKTVTPPGLDGGGAIETTTMRSVKWRTMQPKALITLTECTLSASYDPEVYDDILAMLNQNQEITIEFPDLSTYLFWGWVDKFEPEELSEGEFPTATVTIQPSNEDNSGNEVDPVYTAPPSTTSTTTTTTAP